MTAAAVLLGATAVAAQTTLLRASLACISASEMTVGVLLAAWLAWTALGSMLGGCLAGRMRRLPTLLAALQCAMGSGLSVALWVLHACRMHWAVVPGELLGPGAVLWAALLATSLVSFSVGVCFPVLARMSATAEPSKAAARVYFHEATGSVLGGLLSSLLLVRICSPLQLAAVLMAANLALAILFSVRHKFARIALMVSIAIAATWTGAVAAPLLEQQWRAREWPGFQVLDARDSAYGSLMVLDSGGVRSLYENGLIAANAPDPEAAEEAVHYALLEHPAPHRVLLIGGSATGAVAEVLKHPSVERVDVVELDPELLRLVHERLKDVGRAVFHDHRVKVHVDDGRRFLEQSRQTWDAILVIGPDPETAALNRFHTEEFFLTARARLAPGGVFSISAHSSEEALSPELLASLQSVRRTLDAVFPQVVAIPGDTMHFVASNQGGLLIESSDALLARLRQRQLKTDFVSESFLPYRLSSERMSAVREPLRAHARTRINRDLSPAAYLESSLLWSSEFHPRLATWISTLARLRFAWVLAAAVLIAATLALAGIEFGARAATLLAMTSTGFTSMALTLFLLLGFQAVCGLLYRDLAWLVALLMVGMAAGSALGQRWKPGVWKLQGALMAAPIVLVAAIDGLHAIANRGTHEWLLEALFLFLALAAGMLGGAQFAQLSFTAASINAGVLYGADLIGGCSAALLMSFFLIPVFGFWQAAWFCSIVGAGTAIAARRLRLMPA